MYNNMQPSRELLLGGVFLVILMFIGMRSIDSVDSRVRRSLGLFEELLRQSEKKLTEKINECQEQSKRVDPKLPFIYGITPTFKRHTQKADLTRLAQTLMLVKNFHWIIVEDAPNKTPLVANLLSRTTLRYTHLNSETPRKYKFNGTEVVMDNAKGTEQRNTGLRWLRENRTPKDLGVVYFMDDDNIYSLELFEEMRWTKEASVWPVAFAGGLAVEKAVVDNVTGKVSGWSADFYPDRPFAVDMAGFAFSLPHFLANPTAEFSFDIGAGTQETTFLSQLTTRERLEAKAKNCTEVLVWHVRTQEPNLGAEWKWIKEGRPSDAGMEV